MADNVFKRLVDAGVQFTGVSQAKAEAFVRKLVNDGQVRRKDAERRVGAFVGKGKDAAEAVVVLLQREFERPDSTGCRHDVDEVEHRLEELVSTSWSAAPPARRRARTGRGERHRAPAKKAPAKKAAAKKAPAKKAAAEEGARRKKAAAKKAAGEEGRAGEEGCSARRPARRTATGPSGVRTSAPPPH